MKRQGPALLLFLFILMILGGTALVFVSFISLPTNSLLAKAVRAAGISLLFFGAGELINHPLQKKFSALSPNEIESKTIIHRSRNPCGLGNLFDVLGLISIFIAFSLFFFPYDK